MTKAKSQSKEAPTLHRRAEAKVKEMLGARKPLHAKPEPPKPASELQMELERHKVELQRTRDDVELALEKYIDLYDFAPVGYLTLREDGTIRDANLTGAALLRAERAQVIGHRFSHWVSSESRSAFRAFLRRVFESQAKEVCEVTIHSGEGRSIILRIEAKASEARDECRAALMDITEHRHMDEMLRQSMKLESLGILAGGIAHDFNNMITGIMGNAEIGSSLLPGDSPALPYLARIQQTCQRATDRTRQLLVYAGRGPLLIEPLDMNRLVQEMAQMLLVSSSKTLAIHYDLAPGVPVVLADPAQMHQLVMNIILNASDAIGPDQIGTITFRTRVETLDDADIADLNPMLPMNSGQFLTLEVIDTGCGMSPETMNRIFDPFFTTKFPGRGLGLSTMLGILRSHQGSIEVQSELAQGSSFKLFLPAFAPIKKEVPPETENAAWRGEGLLLLVDDDEDVLAVARAAAKHMGFRVMEAADGRAALEIFERSHRELTMVVMDLAMPHMDGRQSFLAMHALDPSVPVVLTSGYSEQEALAGLADLAGFLPKPYKRAQFRATIQQTLKNNAKSATSASPSS